MSEPRHPGSDSDTGTPRWVKVFGIISLVVVLLFVFVLLRGGGRHGPGRHTQPAGEERRVQQP
jgi:prolyl oligopeptidase PreP (S9A serine peptidase family)